MTMVEKVARVLLAHDPNMQALKRINSKHYARTMDEEWVNCVPEARAALSAMMDATPGMVEAGASCALGWVDETEMWQAMIRAALDEGEG